MAGDASTFSDSWYRIADARLALRPHVQVRRQFFRGERFYVLHDPLNNQFFRLRPAAYGFVARLGLDRTVESVWRECMEAEPDEAPGQDQALRLLAQLHAGNLLHGRLSPDSERMFEREKTRRGRETRAFIISAMFARFPLWDPDVLLRKALPILRRIISPLGGVVWLAVIAAAVKVLIDHAAELRDTTQAVLAPGNFILLYVALICVKLLHETGHAAMCRRFGGEVHVFGVMLMVFIPMPYVDTTSSWGFRRPAARALVGAAGMIVELFVAALATFVWAATGPGTLHSTAYNVIFVASVSTLLFNANPLLRFDGYYILSDLLEIPNLQARARGQIAYLAERFVLGVKTARSFAQSTGEGVWLALFGIGSGLYRVVLSAGILLVLADRYLVVGVIGAVVCVVSWTVLPVIKGLHYLAASPRLARSRPRAIAVSAVMLAVLILALQFLPAPSHFRAPGVIEAAQHQIISAQVAGRLREVLAPSGSEVAANQPLLVMESPELKLELAVSDAELREIEALRTRALEEATAELAAIESRRVAVQKRQARLQEQLAALILRAPHAGRWVAPDLENRRQSWLARGDELGRVIDQRAFEFSAVVSQEEASHLFAKEIRQAQVRLAGEAAVALPVVEQRIIPAERRKLPSSALGFRAGGEVAVGTQDPTGTVARESFFEVRARVNPPAGATLIHGQSGQIRFELPAEPLFAQWMRKLRQLLQKRGLA